MKHLLCIVSQQQIPNYLSAHCTKPDMIHLAVTHDMGTRADFFQDLLRQYLPRSAEMFTFNLTQGVDLPAMQDDVLRHLEEHTRPGDEWIINITGGSKPMAVATYAAAVKFDTHEDVTIKLVYTDNATPQTLHDLEGGEPLTLSHVICVEEFLGLDGFWVRSRRAERSVELDQLARHIAAVGLDESPLKISKDKLRDAQKNGLSSYSAHLRKEVPEALKLQVAECFKHAVDLKGWQVKFLTGIWLENLIQQALQRWRTELGITSDIAASLRMKKGDVENEWDAAFMVGSRFFGVECKSGVQWDKRFSDQIEELSGTLGRISALRKTVLLVTTGQQFQDKEEPNLVNPDAVRRLRESGIGILIKPDVIQLGQSMDDENVVLPLLRNWLDCSQP